MSSVFRNTLYDRRMIYPFSKIVILYNPNSTGASEKNASDLKDKITVLRKGVAVSLKQTEYAGHAEVIGEEYAQKDDAVLIVSSSGDGGYNELINGVMKHTTEKVTVCVLPSGNANDHHRSTGNDDVAAMIAAGNTTTIDVIRVAGMSDGKRWQRYAHSYVGAGLTAYIGKKLTEAKLNPINEKWLVVKYLLKFNHVSLKFAESSRWRRYSSIVYGNINQMSKVIKLSSDSRTDDGKMEVYETRSKSTLKLIAMFIRASVVGFTPNHVVKKSTLWSLRPLAIQCDGEAFMLDAQEMITLTVVPDAVRTIAASEVKRP